MTNIIYAINHLLEAVFLYYYSFSIYPHRRRQSTEMILLSASYALLFYAFLHQSIYLNFTLQILVYTFLFLVLVNTDILDAGKNSLLMLLAISVSELCFDIPTVMFHTDTKFPYPTVYFLIIAVLIIRTIHFVFITLLIKIRKKWIDIPRSSIYEFFTVLFLLISNLAIFAIQALGFITTLNEKTIPWVFSILIALLSLCSGVILFSLFFQNSQYKLLDFQNELQRQKDEKTYNDLVAELDQNQRIMIHDFRKHIQTIDDLVRTKSYSDLDRYIRELKIDPAISEKNTHVRNQTLGVLLARYKKTCEEKHVVLTVDITPDSFVSLSPVETSALLGNLMDNAVNAATKCSNPYIHLRIQHNSQLNQDVLTLVNSCLEAPKQNLRGEYLSNKKDTSSHGVGMRSIKRVVQNNNGMIHSYFSNEDTSFHTTLMIQTTEKSL